MTGDAIETAVEKLDEASEPRIYRFDQGASFEPHTAVLPSAFNPPTLAHFELLNTARKVEGITHIAALLSTRNVDKGIYGASLPDRVAMLLAARQSQPDLSVLASNAARIMDQGRALRTAYPGAAFDFVVGFDTLVRVFEPRYYDDMVRELNPFFRDHRLIATNRGELSVEDVEEFLNRYIVRDFAERIVVCEIPDDCAQLSSTAQREALEQGQAPSGVPLEVRDYILRHGLYRDD